MFGFSPPAPRHDYAACSGCSLCLLVCPVWRRTRDPRLTPEGRAKAMQYGATARDLTVSIESCTLCGACEPVCPENIDLVGMILGLRRDVARAAALPDLQPRVPVDAVPRLPVAKERIRTILLPGPALREQTAALAGIRWLLGCALGDDDGADIAVALEAGIESTPERLERFLAPLRDVGTIIVADGLLLRHLRQWLWGVAVVSLGEALGNEAAVRSRLRETDLYAIEPRAYHADYARLVGHYDKLRREVGCVFNLDLQRIAIPARARSLPQLLGRAAVDDREQTAWVLHGRKVDRIVVESPEDIEVFAAVTALPVVFLGELINELGNAVR